MAAISKWGVPTNAKEVRAFLGYVNFYRPFCRNLSLVAKPLFDLTTLKKKFQWGEEHDNAFTTIKQLLTEDVPLMFPKESEPFYLFFDASDLGVGAVLQQKDGQGNLRPLEYYSKKWNGAEYNYSTPDKELYALILSLKHWYPVLYSAEKIIVHTDHKSLRDFSKTQLLKPRHARWALVLEDFSGRLTINWIPGKKNIVADAISRDPRFNLKAEEVMTNRMQVIIPPEVFPPEMQDSINSIQKRDDQIDLSDDEEKRKEVLEICHDSALAGHYGVAKTFELILRRYWWKGILYDVREYVKSCDVCQRNKNHPLAPSGKLMPLPIPERNWQHLTLDFIVKLPKSDGFDAILVVVDRRSKACVLTPTHESITAEETAHLLWDKVVCRYGVPSSLVSDRGPQFRSKLWKGLHERLGTKVNLSSAYHPQTDGQSERLNQELEAYLRCFSSFEQDNWAPLLPQAEFVHNNSFHSTIGMSPFCAMYGHDAEIGLLEKSNVSITIQSPTADTVKKRFQDINKVLHFHFEKAQNRHKKAADESRREEPKLEIGDEVMISTRNVRTNRPSKKLDYKWIGPYYVKRRINPVAFEIELPHNLKIHNVFHVSLLKRYNRPSDPSRQLPKPPPLRVLEDEEYDIREVLDVRRRGRGFEYLIWWEGYPKAESTWEPQRVLNDDNMLQEWHKRNPNKPSPHFE
ncbi:hypothetical protein SeLEV6574_g08003 [Synchytrium endobioticum]|nr:hypothetical protein SeLEV6574_g08003 [Synchytrium endobioticum]